MYIVKIVGAVRGLEDNMEHEIQQAAESALKDAYGEIHGLFEIMVSTSEEVEHI